MFGFQSKKEAISSIKYTKEAYHYSLQSMKVCISNAAMKRKTNCKKWEVNTQIQRK
jgi:hypothetical protein